MKPSNKIRRLATVTLLLYMLLLVWIIAFKCNMRLAVLDAKIFNQRFTLGERFVMQLSRFAKTDLQDGVVNILFFIPLGMLMPFVIKKHACAKTMLFCFFISAGFEVLQILNCIGAFTYIDIINNTVGGIIGALLYLVLQKKAKERPVEIILKILIALLIPVLIVAAANTILHIDYYL